MPSEKTERNEAILAMREQGETYTAIGKHFNMSRGNAEAIVRRLTISKARKKDAQERMKDKSLESANLGDFLVFNDASTRLVGMSRWEEYQTVEDILNTTEYELLRLPHISIETVKELKAILRKNGLEIKAAVD